MLPAKVLVVDDSPLMRRLIINQLDKYPDIQIIGTAVDGRDALRKIETLRPDVVTLDVEMPVMDGLTALRRIMRTSPLPVIMCSSRTDVGTGDTIAALTAGALDFVTKPDDKSRLQPMVEDLALKIKVAAAVPSSRISRQATSAAVRARPLIVPPHPAKVNVRKTTTRLVVVGCSTGGPAALQRLVPALPGDFPVPVVIVQHIPAGFSQPLAEHLDRKSHLQVRHAQNGDALLAGRVLVAPAGLDLTFQRASAGGHIVLLKKGNAPLPPGGFRPSVDGVMNAAARLFGDSVLGVLMTGMGRDGAMGMKAIKNSRGRTIAEAESSCVVYGMPRAAIEAGIVDRVAPLQRIAQEIINMI